MDLCDDESLPRIFAAIELPGIERSTLALQIVNDRLHVEGQRAMPLKTILSGYPYPNASGYKSPSRAQHPSISITNERGSEIREEVSSTVHYTTRELAFGKFTRDIELPQGTTVRTTHNLLYPNFIMILISLIRSRATK